MSKILVIGAGIFGASIATELAELPYTQVDIIDSRDDIMLGASRANHNRLHLGYHYLRCTRTARQSIEGLLSFLFFFGSAVRFNFPNFYAIARDHSKSSVDDFIAFCREVGIPFKEDYPDTIFLNRDRVSSCFRVPEPIFDLVALRELVFERLKKSGAELKLNHGASRIVRCDPGQGLDVTINERTSRYDFVINCSYHNLSLFTQQLGLAPVGAELQYVLIPHFLYPQEALGLTVMDGEFCSVMPKGFNKNEFILYHVKHSVLNRGFKPGTLNSEPTQAQIDAIYANSVEFFPFLERARHFDQWHTTRAIVRNENDSRLSEIFFDPSIPNYVSILSGKISTCIQVAQAVRGLITNVGF